VKQTLQREELLDQIVGLERRMFVAVRSSSPSACQQQWHTFATMRRMSHSVLSDEFLESYLSDLQEAFGPAAQAAGCCAAPVLSEQAKLCAPSMRRNFFVEKYARIEDQMPQLNHNPRIAEIMAVELKWFLVVQQTFPELLRSSDAFQRYEQAELETYSDNSLELMFRDVSTAEAAGRNLVEERYENLSRMLGFSSIAQMIASSSSEKNGGRYVE
jgi:hypothetical protein